MLVGIVRPVGVEVKLAIVPVEDRSVHELAIAVRILPSPVHSHQKSRFTAREIQAYILSFLNFIWEQSVLYSDISTRQEQAVFLQDNTLLSTVVERTLVIFLKKERATVIRRRPCISPFN